MIPIGKPLKLDCNPIARYNHALDCYHYYACKIENIELTQICCPCLVSWIYDVVIYFYTMFFLTITCQNQTEYGLLLTVAMIAIYALILILPISSLVALILSGIFFLYYWTGVIVFCYNKNKLGTHEFT